MTKLISPVKPVHKRVGRRIGVLLMGLLVALVVVSLPTMYFSMKDDLTSEASATRIDLATGIPVADPFAEPSGTEPATITILLESLDESARQVRLVLLGRRYCDAPCEPLSVVLYILPLNDDPLAMPSTAAIPLPTNDQPFDIEETLPVAGRPQSYPADAYRLHLGVAVLAPDAAGVMLPLSEAELETRGIRIMLEEIMSRFVIKDVVPKESLSVREDLSDLGISLQTMVTFHRPIYLRLESALLILLIGITCLVTVIRQDIDDLLFGVGGLILGMWGIRAVLVQTKYSGVTMIDLTLVLFAILILLGTLVRITLHVRKDDATTLSSSGADQAAG